MDEIGIFESIIKSNQIMFFLILLRSKNKKWVEITQGSSDPKFLFENYPKIVSFIRKHSELFYPKSKIKKEDLRWFSKQKLFALFDKERIFALMRETNPFSIKSGLIEHELIVLPEINIDEQISYIDLFQTQLLDNLPHLCKISVYLTYHHIKFDSSSFKRFNRKNFHQNDIQIRSIRQLARNPTNDDLDAKFVNNGRIFSAEVLKKPLNKKDFEIFNSFNRNAVHEVNKFIENELIRKFFNTIKIGENTYQEYLENWKSLSESLIIVLRLANEIIGFTQVVRHAFISNMAFQHMTYIAPAYRGKGLSKDLKNFSYEFLSTNESWRNVAVIMTNNHSKNLPMIKINERIGFNRVAYFSSWVYDL